MINPPATPAPITAITISHTMARVYNGGIEMITVILTIGLVGALLYLVDTQIPMAPAFKYAIRVIAILALVIYLVRVFGLDIPLPR